MICKELDRMQEQESHHLLQQVQLAVSDFYESGALVEYIFQLFNKLTLSEPVDYILINGDLIAHGVS